MHNTRQADADFYRLIHELLVEQQDEAGAERRRQTRHSYPAKQWIAPVRGPDLPTPGDFVAVCCHDLTRGGFSFLAAARPDYNRLVAAFGDPPQIYVTAEVAHLDEVFLAPSGEIVRARHDARAQGRPLYLVGCRFIERAQREAVMHGGLSTDDPS